MTLWDCKLYMVKYCKCTAQHCVFTSSIRSAVIIFCVSVFSLFCYMKSLMEDSLSEGLAAFLPFKEWSCMIKSPALRVFCVCFWVGGGVFNNILDTNIASPPASVIVDDVACTTPSIFILWGVVGCKMDFNGNERSSSWTPLTGAQQGLCDSRPQRGLLAACCPDRIDSPRSVSHSWHLKFRWTRFHQDWL